MRMLTSRLLLSAVVVLAGVAALFGSTATASQQGRPPSYFVSNFPSLGGSSSAGSSINDFGLIAGYSNLPGDETRHATVWLYGLKLDLGTLGGPNSSVLWPVKNNRGLVAGIAETDEIDPLGENWSCSAFFPGDPSGHVCRGFVWEHGKMKALDTLGGTHSFAASANNKGQVVGWAETAVEDPTCVAPQVLEFHATIWDADTGAVTELPPLPGHSASAATAINDAGQVVGISGICDQAVGRFSAISAVIWEGGVPTDIGNLGGVAWNTPMAINNHGTVVGFSNVSAADGGAFNEQAFIWTAEGGIENLGTLPGDTNSQALGVNDRGQVVGQSCGADGCRAFLWQDGVMTDLNTLVRNSYDDHLTFANDINDLGMITGGTDLADSDETRTFFAFPIPSWGR